MGSFGPLEIGIIFLIVLLVFGAKRIPEIARGMGKGIREFKDATSDIKRELDVNEPAPARRIEPPRAPAQAPAPRADSPAQQVPPAAPVETVKPDIEHTPPARG